MPVRFCRTWSLSSASLMMSIAAASAGAGDSAGRSSIQFPVTRPESAMRISIEIEEAMITGTLEDSEAAWALPLYCR